MRINLRLDTREKRTAAVVVCFCVLFFLSLFTNLGTWADTASQTIRVAFRMNPFQTLSIGPGQAGHTVRSTVTIPRPGTEDLARGYIELPSALELHVRSNVPWAVKVRTDDPDMGTSFDGTFTKSLTDFKVRVAGGLYLMLTNQDQILTQGNFGNYTFEVDYRVLFSPQTHRDGNYRLNVIYTISTR